MNQQIMCHEMVTNQWDQLSVDSGFSSDPEKTQNQQVSRKLKTKSLYHENDGVVANPKSNSRTNSKNKSLPYSFRLHHDSPSINWDEASLKDFVHVRHLGGGGYSKVDLVQFSHSDHKEYFALKKISRRHLLESKQAKQFEEEKDILGSSRSKFIPRLFKSFYSSNHAYLLAEACLGGDLFSFLENLGPVQLETARFVVACVIEALDYLHRVLHVIHRDVKAENLLIGKQGILKLADFGFCKKLNSSNSYKTNTFCGTPGYVAPEIILHKGHSFSADYFSLGVVLYETLTCRSPFRREAVIDTYKATLKGIRDVAFPARVDHLSQCFITELCHPDPDRRLSEKFCSHDWFRGFDWSSLKSGKMTSPLSTSKRSSQ